jgi:hypothetical protein
MVLVERGKLDIRERLTSVLKAHIGRLMRIDIYALLVYVILGKVKRCRRPCTCPGKEVEKIEFVFDKLTVATLPSHLHYRVTMPTSADGPGFPISTARGCSPTRESLATIFHISPPHQKLVGRTDMVDF